MYNAALRMMMGVIVVVCAAFGLAVSEAKTEIMLIEVIEVTTKCILITGKA